MEDYKLGAIESRFADIIWDNEPMTTKQLVALCAEELQWKRTTTYSVLKKLCEKGFFKMENSMVSTLVTKADYNSFQSEKFIQETFQGSLPALVLSFGSRKKLNPQEIEELQKIINDLRGRTYVRHLFHNLKYELDRVRGHCLDPGGAVSSQKST